MTTKPANPVTPAHPQSPDLPVPLEVHPSIDPELAREMMRVADLFSEKPHMFNGSRAYRTAYPQSEADTHACCICGQISPDDSYGRAAINHWPQHASALSAIYDEASDRKVAHNARWAVARIEHFLRTGQ